MAPSAQRKVTLAIVGAGQRGRIYASYALSHPDLCSVVAVAEPSKHRREVMAKEHQVPQENVFTDWKDFAKTGRIADAVVIAVLDDLHAEVVHALAPLGYHILCEKPIATSISDCIHLIDDVKKAGIIFGVGHVLRYSPYNAAIREVIDSGVLGEIINIQHLEPVGHEHFAHSFVRGNWHSEKETTFSLMAKSCHDIDILSFYLPDNPPEKVSSFGSLLHFKPSKKPKEAGEATKCIDCNFEPHCPYSAKKIYLEPVQKNPESKWHWAQAFVDVVDIENVAEAIKTTAYGECVYNGHNDVCDQQVVNIQYKNGQTASFTMVAFSEAICARQTRIHGTRGELVGDMATFDVFDFTTKTKTHHTPSDEGGGHGGGDLGLARSFVQAVALNDQSQLRVTPDDILASHLLVFAAEKSRREETMVQYERFEEKVMNEHAVAESWMMA